MDTRIKSGQAEYARELDQLIEQKARSFNNKDYRQNPTEAKADLVNNSNVFFTTSVLGMTAISHVIEEQALKINQERRFYVAFQKFSRIKPQQELYRKMLAAQVPVYLFGTPDVNLWERPLFDASCVENAD